MDVIGSRRARSGLIIGFTAVCAAQAVFSSVHLDLSRDIFVAWRLVHGVEIPWHGPVLADTIHLGPIYDWLLALFLFLTGNWLGTVVLLGLLASLKVPLAYLLGKELHSRRAGFLFAAGLFVPYWGTFEWLFPGHNLLTTALTLAFLLSAVRYCREFRRRHLVAMSCLFVLALHAHPTAVALAWIGAGVLLWSWRQGALHAKDSLLAAAVGILPLVPYLAWDATQSFVDIGAGGKYLSNGESTGHISSALPIFVATAFGGTRYWFATELGWPAVLANLACAIISIGGVLGIGSAIILTLRRENTKTQRIAVIVGFCALVLILLTTALIRSVTPYYQTVVLRTVLTGIVAIGLAALGNATAAKLVRTFVVAAVSMSFLVCAAAGVRHQFDGDWPFSFFPLFNVTGESETAAPFMMLPAYAIGNSGPFLCAHRPVGAHGALAQQLLHDYSMDMRLSCGRSEIQLGGADPSREHWLGLSRASFQKLGVSAQDYFGPLGVVPARPLVFGSAIAPQTSPIYPAYEPRTVPYQKKDLRVRLAIGQRLAVSNVAWSFVPNPKIYVRSNGKIVAPVVEDAVTSVYVSSTEAEWDVEIESIDPSDVDIVTF